MAVLAGRKPASPGRGAQSATPKPKAGRRPPRAAAKSLLQAKLTINDPNDRFEREADSVAERVLHMPERRAAGARSAGEESRPAGRVQRQPDEEEAQTFALQRQEEEEEAQTFSLQRQEEEEEAQTASLQRQQQEEQEAQTLSLQRQEMEDEEAQTASLQRQAEEGEEEAAQTYSLQRQEEEQEAQTFSLQRQQEEEEQAQTASLQRQTQEEEEETAQTLALQREQEEEETQAATMARQEEEEEEQAQTKTRGGRPRVTAAFETQLVALKAGGGRPLDSPLLTLMESRFGRSFSGVRVHTGPQAARLAQQANARAFTVGKHLVFGGGEYRPNADQGRRLIAHELTHVLQQRGGLHSVQREMFGPDSPQPRQDEDSLLTEIQHLMGLDGESMPAAIQAIASELLRTALNSSDGGLLAPLTAAAAAADSTSRLIESSEYSLSISLVRTARSARAVWTLTRAGEKRPLFGHSQTTAADGASAEAGVDDAQIRIATPTPPRYASDPAVASGSGGPQESPLREIPSSPASQTTPAPSPPESEKLAAANAAPDVAPHEPQPEGRGDNAGSDDPAQTRPPIDVQADDDVPEEEEPPEPDVEAQRKAVSHAPARPGPAAQRKVSEAVSSPGTILPAPLLGQMESAFNADFSSVRLHHGRAAGDAARSLHAKAFTVGRHIVFGEGQFEPSAAPGRELLAHELAHFVQQRQGRSPAALIQRQDEECPPPEPVPEVEVVPSPAGPNQDPAFSSMEQRTENRAENQAAHGSGDDKSASANAAAEVKDGEKKSHAQKDQVGDMAAKAESPPAFDKQAFINSVLQEVQKIAPETLDDVMKFSDRGKAGQVKSAVQGEVGQATEETQGPLKESATADPGAGESPRTASPLDVEPPGPQAGSIRADRAMPPPKTNSEMDLRADTVRADNILKEACITREYMDEHGDPELAAGAAAQDELHAATEQGPQTFREGEAAELQDARAGASAEGAEGVAGMFGARSGEFGEVGSAQQQTKTDNEVKREAAAAEINGVFTSTQTKVQDRLTQLDQDVNTTFDRETQAATDKFERFIRANAEKYEKSWFESAVEFLADKLFDVPPPEVQDFYREGRVTFLNDMEVVIGNVADIVDKGLKDARKIVEDGKKEVQQKLDALGSDLEDFKQQMSEQMNDKFRELEGDIAAKQGDIVKNLAQRYVKAFEKVKAIENQVREEYKNAFDKAKEALEAAVDFVVGWAEKLAAVVGGAATKIIKSPGKFLSNLGAGIIQGLQMFMANIGENIQAAVVAWLTGNMAGGGIQLPATFDAKGIIGFLLDLVGLGVAGIKEIARKVFGHQAVSLIEKGVEGFETIKQIFDILASEGPSGLFKFLQSEFAKMKEQVMGEIGKALAEGLIIAGIKRVLGIISGLVSGGVGTVITIVLTIIDVILWFRDNAAQIAELVSTIASMAMAVLNGQVAALAGAINTVLKRILPLVLGFVGALVGIGGVVRKIQKIFKAIGKPARNAIRKLFLKFKNLVKKLLKKFKKKGKKKSKKKQKLSGGKVKKLIITALKKPAAADDAAKAIAETKQLAESLKAKYQATLESGTIRITILDQTPQAVEKDDDIDIDVALSPGTKVARKVNITLLKKFGKEVSASHQAARTDINASIGKIPKSKSNIQNWDTVKSEIQSISPVSKIIQKPMLASHGFGAALAPVAVSGVKRVDPAATEGQIRRVKGQIDSAAGNYATPNQLLKAAVYNARASTSRIESAVETAYAEEVRGRDLERPALRETTKAAIRAAADKDAAGDFIDPNPPRLIIPKGGPFHYGHKTGHEHRKLVKQAEAQGMTQGEFNEWVNSNPQWFQIEDPARNVSHAFES
jgi:hypothetical protein